MKKHLIPLQGTRSKALTQDVRLMSDIIESSGRPIVLVTVTQDGSCKINPSLSKYKEQFFLWIQLTPMYNLPVFASFSNLTMLAKKHHRSLITWRVCLWFSLKSLIFNQNWSGLWAASISESQTEHRGRVRGSLPTCKCSKKYALNMMFVTNPQSHVILCHHHLLTVCISSAACPAPRWGKSWNGFSQTSSKAASTKLVFCGLPSLSSLS